MMDRPQKILARGFTLVELLIAMAIGLTVLTATSSAFISQQKAYKLEEQKIEMFQTARATMDIISSEVKMAGYHWDPTGASLLQTTDPTTTPTTYVGMLYDTTQLEIKADLNSDGETDGTTTNDDGNEEIVYAYDSANMQITRDTGNGARPLAENIEDFSFKYFKHDSVSGSIVEVTNSANEETIRVIEITIIAKTADPDPNYSHPTYGDGYRRHTVTSYIAPPNLRN